MKPISRRSFLTQSAVAAGFAASGLRGSSRAAPARANGAIGVAIIGVGNKGLGHLRELIRRNDVRVTALCDVDPARIERALKEPTNVPFAPFTCTNPREIFDRPDVDAVMVVTPNQWHALLGIWACQAGKDVYVEKPMTHTVWEGRKLVEAAAKYNRIVQVGTQFRSEAGFGEAVDWLRAGHLGRITHVHCIYFDIRPSTGRRLPWYPESLDYDLFCGPAPVRPLERDSLHYDWHWVWDTGGGDLANNGVHTLDSALRLLGPSAAPQRVIGLGGRYVIDDMAQTPNSLMVAYEFPEFPVIFEHRALPAKPGVTFSDQIAGKRGGMIVYCEGGYLTGVLGCIGYDRSGKEIRRFSGEGGAAHVGNFLAAVRSRRKKDLAAPIEGGHASASLCNFGNISYRVGAPSSPGDVIRALESIPAAAEICRGFQTHLAVHGLDLTRQRLTLGPWLRIDSANDAISGLGSGDNDMLARARFLLRGVQRPPYAIPEQV